MAYPRELHETTPLDGKAYPFQFFFNANRDVKVNQQILFLHWHEHFEIIRMEKGSAIFHIDSQPYTAHPGDVLMVPAGGLHVGYSISEGEVAFLSIVFNASLFQDWLHDPIHASFLLPYLQERVQFPVQPAEVDPACATYFAILDQAISEFNAKRPAFQLIIKSQLHILLTMLARAFLPEQLPPAANRRYIQNRDRFKSLIHHIETNIGDKHTVEEAAKRLNLNPYHFCKMFKKLTGRTFIEYVNVCRVNEAERLLLESELSITEIAGKIGCDNPNYFTKLFKQYKGVIPSKLRK
ncbi:transcriptional regulator, AraC family [Paenibacillus curdlanolyticus YK9]|uniref:Transcriptional regulator, AraC family n=1 Tax=Paenibacillus curdlanolyticus YK9 TaxID=717606 RepID=E0ICT2_9BACL|nr:AraC family transcriptional regulator [Paenibacillus curdlanolyticus]EFM09968.1 transcriptional regulator, AraC family [Paenibacillus curdlanolyticus YK9]